MDSYCVIWSRVWFTDKLIQFIRWYYGCWPSGCRLSSHRIRGAIAISALVDRSHPLPPTPTPQGWNEPQKPQHHRWRRGQGSGTWLFYSSTPVVLGPERGRDRKNNRTVWRLSLLQDNKYGFNKYMNLVDRKAIRLTGVPVHLYIPHKGKTVKLQCLKTIPVSG